MISNRQIKIANNHFLVNRLGKIGTWFVIFAIVFASLRGWVILNLNMPPDFVYGFSSLLLSILAMYGFSCRLRIKDRYLISLRNLLLINLLFGFYYLISHKLLGGSFDLSLIYLYLLPYIVFLFLRISVDKIHIAFYLIFLGISFSVLDNFMYSYTLQNSISYLEDYNLKLRPLTFEGLSRTGRYIRVGGYTSSYHDSANILGILGSYYYAHSIIHKNMLSLIIFIISFLAMTFTQSAANIVIALFTCSIITFYITIKKPKTGNYIMLLAITLSITFALAIPEFLIFSERIGPHGDWGNMIRNISYKLLFFPQFWIGHDSIIGSISTEVAFLNLILEQGVFSACLLFWILIYPAYIFLRSKSESLQSLPYLAAVIFGFLSLAHYGSLFRITSIALFYAMYALFFINEITENQKILK